MRPARRAQGAGGEMARTGGFEHDLAGAGLQFEIAELTEDYLELYEECVGEPFPQNPLDQI